MLLGTPATLVKLKPPLSAPGKTEAPAAAVGHFPIAWSRTKTHCGSKCLRPVPSKKGLSPLLLIGQFGNLGLSKNIIFPQSFSDCLFTKLEQPIKAREKKTKPQTWDQLCCVV